MQGISQARLKELLSYSKSTGLFHWRVTRGGKCAGSLAGSPHCEGYVSIRVDGQLYLAHRLAWLYATGSMPAFLVDHKNGDRADNRFRNLRDELRRVNQENMREARADNCTGLLGATLKHGRSVFRARIRARGVTKHLGHFSTAEAAHRAYLKAKRQLHEGCTI